MDLEQVSTYRNTSARLREHAQRLKQQSFWMVQQFSQIPGQPMPAEVVFEVQALEDESHTMNSLAAKLERRLREAGMSH